MCLSFPWHSPGLRFKKQVGYALFWGCQPLKGQSNSGAILAFPRVAHLPLSFAIPEHPGHGKPNLKGSQRPGLRQSEPENVTIVPLET